MSIENKMTLSDEALGTLMMCLQKSILEQADIVPMLKNLDFTNVKDELYVLNPPIVKFGLTEVEEEETTTDA